MGENPATPPPEGLLRDALAAISQSLDGLYVRSDNTAVRHQARHRRISLTAVSCGTLAILLAIFQLTGLYHAIWPAWLEFVAITLAGMAVAMGLWSSMQSRWLLARHRAERCRFLKFRMLIDPELWSGQDAPPAGWLARLKEETIKTETLTAEDLHQWTHDDQVQPPPAFPGEPAGGAAGVRGLAEYYLGGRLRVQMAYFEAQARQNTRQDAFTRRLSPVIFFVSVLFAMSHFAVELLPPPGEDTSAAHPLAAGAADHASAIHQTSTILIFLAAAIPVLGFGIRAYRAAYEFARNTIRFRAKHLALRHIAERLPQETDPATILRILWYCEQIIESEHHEWLRLMSEAEWFG